MPHAHAHAQVWDEDCSGALDFAEIGKVLQWYSENTPSEVDFARMFATMDVPAGGKMDAKAFEAWMLSATAAMSVHAVTVGAHAHSPPAQPRTHGTRQRACARPRTRTLPVPITVPTASSAHAHAQVTTEKLKDHLRTRGIDPARPETPPKTANPEVAVQDV